MKFLVIGCGSIGRRHLRNLSILGYDDLLVFRSQRINIEEIERKYHVVSFFNLEDALAEAPDVAIIANPTAFHIPIAISAARANVHLLIEKPISHRLSGTSELMKIVRENDLVAMVAYPLRFYEGMVQMRRLLQEGTIGRPIYVHAEAGSYLPDWRPGADYRQSYSAQAGQGGGVVLDLSHETDYLYWLFGPIRAVTSQIFKLGDLEIDVEDTAEILLEHESGVFSSVHLDYLQRSPSRKCKIIGTEGTLILDFFTNSIDVYRADRKRWENILLDIERNDMYLKEITHFIACVNRKEDPLVTLEQGIHVLQVALAAKESAIYGVGVEVEYDC